MTSLLRHHAVRQQVRQLFDVNHVVLRFVVGLENVSTNTDKCRFSANREAV